MIDSRQTSADTSKIQGNYDMQTMSVTGSINVAMNSLNTKIIALIPAVVLYHMDNDGRMEMTEN